MVVNSEFEALALHLAGALDSKWIRYWEVAGTPARRDQEDRPPERSRLEAEHAPVQPCGGVRHSSCPPMGGARRARTFVSPTRG